MATLQVEIDDKLISSAASKLLNQGGWIYGEVQSQINRIAQRHLSSIDLEARVQATVEMAIDEMLQDIVYRQLKHVAKLAVDRHLAAARELTVAEAEA